MSFTIANDTNDITLHTTLQDAEPNAQHFRDEAGLAELAANWPASRLIEVWNNLPGATPVKKFTDRKTAVSRIWKAIQSLREPVSAEPIEQGEAEPVIETPQDETPQDVEVVTAIETAAAEAEAAPEPETAPVESETVPEREPALAAPVAPQTPDVAPSEAPTTTKAAGRKKAPKPAREKGTREGSKTETILGLMKQPGGTTLKAIMDATNWQAHSVRGFISGTLGKKMGLTVISAKGENGERTYSINA